MSEGKEDILDKYENYEAYWDLVAIIDLVCDEAIENGKLYGDDIISALDRVKSSKMIEIMKYRFDLERKNESENDGK